MNLVATHAAVLLLGIGVGYLIARIELKPRETAVDIKKARDRVRRVASGPAPMILSAAALVCMAIYVPIAQAQQHTNQACLTQYANRLHDSLAPRQATAQELQDADIAFKHAVAELFVPGHDKADIARVKRTLAANTAIADNLNKKRDAHPYPPSPRQVCPR